MFFGFTKVVFFFVIFLLELIDTICTNLYKEKGLAFIIIVYIILETIFQ